MGFTIEDALVQTQDIYHLELLAGKNGFADKKYIVKFD